jgi:ferredoxin-NADP reductase
VDIGGVRTSRAYSIASSPHQSAYYEIAVRRVADGFVSDHLVDLLQPGNELDCQGPAGTFFHNPLFHGDDVVFLAGGSGITPFASMIREVTDRGLGRRIQLIYGNRVPEDVLYQADFEERAGRHNNFRCDLVISEPPAGYLGHTGFMTAELIASLVKRPLEKMFYLCGPEAMYTLCRAALEQLGVPRRRIRSEVFRPARVITAEPGWPPEISAEARFSVQVGRKSISARAGEPLLAALERAGLTPPSSCRAGECSLCRTRLVSGRVFQPAPVKLRKADRRFGYIHPCMAYPLADVVLEI